MSDLVFGHAEVCAQGIGLMQGLTNELANGYVSIHTQGALHLERDSMAPSVRPSMSVLWGLMRCIQSAAYPECFISDIDPSHEKSMGWASYTVNTTGHSLDSYAVEHSSVFKSGASFHGKLLSVPDMPITRGTFQIRPCPRGSLHSLVLNFVNAEATVPEGFLSVSVHSVGINFRDVLNVLGAYPGDPGPPGADCAGIVCRSVHSHPRYHAGDAVLALASGAFASVVDVPTNVVAHKCASIPFEMASSTPSVYMTVWLALEQACGASTCDTILIHAGSGGIGSAAVNVANAVGACVWSTAEPGRDGTLYSVDSEILYCSVLFAIFTEYADMHRPR